MRIKKGKIVLALICLLTLGGNVIADAHSGRTDGSGGHKDNKNKSGLGSYHYHCGGFPPHLHENGCPYKSKPEIVPPKNPNNENNKKLEEEKKAKEAEAKKAKEAEAKKAKEEQIRKEKEKINKKGYDIGLKDGYEEKENIGGIYSETYQDEYVEGYEKGYKEGASKLALEIKEAKNVGYQAGIDGKEKNNTFTKKSLNEAYELAYANAYNQYTEKMIKEYEAKGEADASGKKEQETFNDSINEKFQTAYLSAYDTKKIEVEKEETTQSVLIGLGTIAVAGSGFVVYKKKKKLD